MIRKTLSLSILITLLVTSVLPALAQQQHPTGDLPHNTPTGLPQPPSPVNAAATTLTVDIDIDENDGGCVAGDCSLREAITAAAPGDTIVFDNDYTITLSSPLVISKNLTLDGGEHAITVSGNEAVRVFQVFTDTHVTFDSLTIAHGKIITPELGAYPTGGGLKIEPSAVVTLTHSSVLSNTAIYYSESWGEYIGYGGGIFNEGTLTVIDTTLAGNSAGDITGYGSSYGGAIYNWGTLNVADSMLTNNAAIDGGAIYSGNSTTLTVQNSTIAENASPCGGGGILNRGTATVTDSRILNNVSPDDWCEGGAAGISNNGGTMTVTHSIIAGNSGEYNNGGLSNYEGTLMLMDNAIYSNTAGSAGGGIYNWWNAALTVQNCAIYSNTADYAGGGIYSGPDTATLILVNSTLFANTATQEGGGLSNGGRLTMTNSTIVSNTATTRGGGFLNKSGSSVPALANTIFWNNAAVTGPQIHNATAISPTIRTSDIEGSGGSGAGWNATLGTDGGGNIDDDPLFVNAAAGDLRLPFDSPAADVGDNSAIPAGITTDLAGSPRILNSIVDMGAHEAAGGRLSLDKSVTPDVEVPRHSVVTYTVSLDNADTIDSPTAVLTDPLPNGVVFGGWIQQPGGMIKQGNTLTWTGTLSAGHSVTAIFTATHSGNFSDIITNTAHFNTLAQTENMAAIFTVVDYPLYLPLVLHAAP